MSTEYLNQFRCPACDLMVSTRYQVMVPYYRAVKSTVNMALCKFCSDEKRHDESGKRLIKRLLADEHYQAFRRGWKI